MLHSEVGVQVARHTTPEYPSFQIQAIGSSDFIQFADAYRQCFTHGVLTGTFLRSVLNPSQVKLFFWFLWFSQ